MPDQETLLIRGQIAENESRMQELEHRCLNAVQAVRNLLVLYVEPGDIDLGRLRAALADVAEIVEEYSALKKVTEGLRQRLG